MGQLLAVVQFAIAWRGIDEEARPRRRFCGGGASWYLLIGATYCNILIYTHLGGLQSRGAELVRLAGGFSVGAPPTADL